MVTSVVQTLGSSEEIVLYITDAIQEKNVQAMTVFDYDYVLTMCGVL